MHPHTVVLYEPTSLGQPKGSRHLSTCQGKSTPSDAKASQSSGLERVDDLRALLLQANGRAASTHTLRGPAIAAAQCESLYKHQAAARYSHGQALGGVVTPHAKAMFGRALLQRCAGQPSTEGLAMQFCCNVHYART